MTQGSFLYYIPNITKEQVTRAFVAGRPEAVPLFDLVHSPRLFSLHCQVMPVINGGPDGGSGVIISGQPVVDTPEQKHGYYPDCQKWQKFGEQWVGYQTDMLPGPESLRRVAQVAGQEVEMGDGLGWNAPILRPFHEKSRTWGCGFPTVVGIDPDGKRMMRVHERFAKTWETASTIGAYLFDGLPASELDHFGWAIECLSVNYRLSEIEATILQLGDSRSLLEVLRAAVDEPLVLSMTSEVQQMNENPTQQAGGTNT